jgi:bifunctional polynucleotide phosphatase/kinase
MNVVILTGLPGAGKSTVCKDWFPNYVRINQDTLGNRQACIDEMRKQLDQGHDVVIDRVNHTKQQRSFWIDVAKGYPVKTITSVVLAVPEEECIARIHARRDHETISEDMPLEKKKSIVYKFHHEFEMPTLSEGFNTVIIHRNE